jgi:HlyD family secretion protein
VDVGTTVAASLQAPTLFTIAQDLSEVQVEAKVDEADIGRIRTGQPVAFTVDAYPPRQFEGRVQQIRKAHEVFQNVVTYAVIVSAQNHDLALFPGMTAIVRITVSEARDVLKVPVTALRYVPEGRRQVPSAAAPVDVQGRGVPGVVWVLDERQEPQPLALRIGTSDSYFSEVVSGRLQRGDAVIVGQFRKPRTRGWLRVR